MTPNQLLLKCEKIINDRFSAKVKLHFHELVADYSSYLIIRCKVEKQNDSNLPNSLIVKKSKNPEKVLWNEIRGLDFLNSFSELQGIAPITYGFDKNEEIVLMEDLDKDCKENEFSDNLLAKVLLKKDNYDNSINALTEFNKTIAKIQALTLNRYQDYSDKYVGFEGSSKSRHAIYKVESLLLQLSETLELLDLKIPKEQAIKAEINDILNRLKNPARFYGFSHGDFTPANALYINSKIRLFDLETSQYRHIFLDGTYSRMRYLQSIWAMNIPSKEGKQIEEEYRKELINNGFLLVENDKIYNKEYVACSFAWLAVLLSYAQKVLEEDKRWGRSTFRQRIINALVRFIEISKEKKEYANLLEMSQIILGSLLKRWGIEETQLPIYPGLVK